MGRPPKNWNSDARRVETGARVATAEEVPVQQAPVMRTVSGAGYETTPEVRLLRPEEIPPLGSVQSDPDVVAMFAAIAEDAAHQDIPESAMVLETLQAVAEGRPYYPIDDATPRDGSLVEGRAEDGTEFMMIWRQTRKYDSAQMKWVQTGFWSGYLDRQPLAKQPVEWRRLEYQVAPPGAIMA
jgi:hypothetical protein